VHGRLRFGISQHALVLYTVRVLFLNPPPRGHSFILSHCATTMHVMKLGQAMRLQAHERGHHV
jgi:hypothetical protein